MINKNFDDEVQREREERGYIYWFHNNRYLPQATTNINEEYKEEIKKKKVVEVLVVILS